MGHNMKTCAFEKHFSFESICKVPLNSIGSLFKLVLTPLRINPTLRVASLKLSANQTSDFWHIYGFHAVHSISFGIKT